MNIVKNLKKDVLFLTLSRALKEVSKFKDLKEKERAIKYILDKANSMLFMVNSRLENIQNLTDKKKKKELDKLKLNQKILAFIEKNKEFVEGCLKKESDIFKQRLTKLEEFIGEH